MSIPPNLAIRIIKAVQKHKLSGNAVMLGRQNFVAYDKPFLKNYMDQFLSENMPIYTYDDFRGLSGGYSEFFFTALGFDSIDSIDASDFEGASIIANLGEPWDDTHKERFDYIYDGGTTEHVFELPTALRNIDKMLKPGGYFHAHHPTNNFINHGFFQISPEMAYGFWHIGLGYEVIDLKLVPLRPVHIGKAFGMTNPMITKLRPRVIGKLPEDSPLILDYIVRKPLKPQDHKAQIYQSDYMLRWLECKEKS